MSQIYVPAISRLSKSAKKRENTKARAVACGPGIDSRSPTNGTGGWGRLPNVSPIDYADDDPRGWVYVDGKKRSRRCRIDAEPEPDAYP